MKSVAVRDVGTRQWLQRQTEPEAKWEGCAGGASPDTLPFSEKSDSGDSKKLYPN